MTAMNVASPLSRRLKRLHYFYTIMTDNYVLVPTEYKPNTCFI